MKPDPPNTVATSVIADRSHHHSPERNPFLIRRDRLTGRRRMRFVTPGRYAPSGKIRKRESPRGISNANWGARRRQVESCFPFALPAPTGRAIVRDRLIPSKRPVILLTASPIRAVDGRMMAESRTPYGASLVAGAMLFAFLLAVPAILADPDTLWQIHTGEW